MLKGKLRIIAELARHAYNNAYFWDNHCEYGDAMKDMKLYLDKAYKAGYRAAKKELNSCTNVREFDKVVFQRTQFKAQCSAYREALEYYANPENYKITIIKGLLFQENIFDDFGNKAREVLDRYK